ncbi:uncharacterized protein LOC121370740 isoform X2 [Gigantopelta aegis]|nr:uncharacterized protein LOC121370740 isoform X2 [Gigantopelta aegis]
MKLFVLLLIFTCVALQQCDALRLQYQPWPRWIRRPFPGPIGMPTFPGPIGYAPMIKGRDVATELDTEEDESLDERDIQDLIDDLELNDDDLRSLEELNDEQ